MEISNTDRLKKQQELNQRKTSRQSSASRAPNIGLNEKNSQKRTPHSSKSVVRSLSKPRVLKFRITKKSLVRAIKGSMDTGKNDEKLKTVKASKRSPFPITALIMTLIVTGLFMFLIMSYVQINEYTLEVSRLRSDLSSLQAQRKDLTYELDEKNDMLAIEQYATENLHMVKLDQLTKKHITIDREDKIEVVESEPTEDNTVVTTMMSSFFSNFAGLLEYLK